MGGMAPASRGAPGPAFGPVPAGPDFNKTSSRRGPGVKRGSLASPAHDHAACPSRARAPAEKSKCHRTSSGGYLLFMGWTRQGDAAGCCRWRRLLLLGTESSPSVMDTNERPRWLLLPHCPNCLSPAGSSPPLPQFVLSRLACRPSSPRPAAHRTRARAHTHRHGRWTARWGWSLLCRGVGRRPAAAAAATAAAVAATAGRGGGGGGAAAEHNPPPPPSHHRAWVVVLLA